MDPEKIRQFEQASPMRMMSRLNRLHQNNLAGRLAAVGIARGSLPFVLEVLCNEGVIQEGISRSLSIDRAATARALLQLEEGGFVVREEDPEDRRRKRVRTTDKTRRLSRSILSILEKQREILFAGFDDREREQLLDMLGRMTENMLEAAAP